MKLGLVGFGALGKYLYKSITESEEYSKMFQFVFVWNRTVEKIDTGVPKELILTNLKDFSKFKVDMIIEVAHPSITCEFGAEFLKFSNFFCGSPTALADLKLETILRHTAEKYGNGLYIPSGALWGAQDIEKMAKLGDLKGLTITMKKHPSSLKVEPILMKDLKKYHDDHSMTGEFVLFEGSVRDLCPLAPNNVNTMACAALAGFNLGFDKVKARLVADKSLEAHVIEIEVLGPRSSSSLESDKLGEKREHFSVNTVRYNPAKVGAVTGNATYASFFSSLICCGGKGTGFHFC
jgi:aspartate dehydrogenase